MAKLKTPIADQLSSQVEEAAIQRIWAGVQQRRHGSAFGRQRSIPTWGWGLAAAALSAVLLSFVLHARRVPPASPLEASLAGPLVSRAGQALSVLGGEPASHDDLSDGSAIQLDPGSRLEVLENTSRTFATVLRSGRGSFAVRPGGPRRWTIEAGVATVEVVGTRFNVSRVANGVDVSVEHGVVLVRSELIPDHVQRLTAGQKLSIREPARDPVPEPHEAQATPPLGSAAPGKPAAEVVPSMDQLLEQADARRLHGDVSGAEAALRLALKAHAHEPRAALTAFTLGKLLMDAAGRPREAAAAFAQCLAASPPGVMAEDAQARLAEAHGRAGDLEAARIAARQYRSRYPSGRHLAELSRWLDAP